MPASTEFQGMTALVTGASSGIGAETAVAFGSRGAYVLVHYNASREGAEDALRRLREAGGDGELLAADLSTRRASTALFNNFAPSRALSTSSSITPGALSSAVSFWNSLRTVESRHHSELD
jgi:NAD(P)-dependent dehydrogenase (short-subunit alcohol dehydrogenase family)